MMASVIETSCHWERECDSRLLMASWPASTVFWSVVLCLVYFLFVIVSTGAINCLERLISEMTCYVSSETLNPTLTLTAIFSWQRGWTAYLIGVDVKITVSTRVSVTIESLAAKCISQLKWKTASSFIVGCLWRRTLHATMRTPTRCTPRLRRLGKTTFLVL